jgi:hypothetical protein
MEAPAKLASLRSAEHCSARNVRKLRGAMLHAPFKWAFCRGLDKPGYETITAQFYVGQRVQPVLQRFRESG